MHYKTFLQEADNPVTNVKNQSSANSVEVGQRIRAARAKAGVTRKQLAVASGASERYLAHLEAGTGNPSVDMLTAIGDALDLAIADLLPLGGERGELEARAAAIMRRLPKGKIQSAIEWMQRPLQSDSGKGNRIALIGLRGAGKTALGEALARRLNLPFFEISTEVERVYGGGIGLLIEMNGQAALRRYEAEVLEAICRDHAAAVIAAPGAIVADGPLYNFLLSATHSIWLEATPQDHMNRVIAQGDLRPMGSGRGAMDDLKAILASRAPDYARADTKLDTSAQDFDHTVDKLERLTRAFAT
jgi:XRE family transcriptional regulator, aerobic/anaerobic benzoate catabolism transcriptional regulator